MAQNLNGTAPDLMAIHVADAVVSEKALLGGIMLNPEILPVVTAHLDLTDFFHTDHKKIFKAILDLHNFGIEPDFKISS